METPLYLNDFMTGMLAALASTPAKLLTLRDNRLDHAFDRLRGDLESEARANNLDVRFVLDVDPFHGDSQALHEALHDAARCDLISLDNPEFQEVRLKLTAADAPRHFRYIPGTPTMYQRLASRLLDYYFNPPRA